MIVPIALYNSEVWGVNTLSSNLKNTNLFDSKLLFKHTVEGLQTRFLKMILGVSKRTSSWGVLGETGRAPLTVKIFTTIIKFYFHLRNTSNNLLKAALSTNTRLAKEGNKTWFRALERISKFLNLEQLLVTSNMKEINNQLTNLKKTSTKLFIDEWQKERSELSGQSSKLGVFLSIKTSFSLSDYLIKSVYPSYRIALSKIRLLLLILSFTLAFKILPQHA